MFDFSKFTQEMSQSKENNTTAEVSAEKSQPAEVIQDIAKEVNGNTTSEVSEMTPEKIKEQAEFLKKQKEKSEEKETSSESDSKANSSKKKSKKDTKAKKETKTKKEEEKIEPVTWTKSRTVIAYGQVVYEETGTTTSLEEIREKLVNVYGYSEFKDTSRCKILFDAKTGEVYPEITFNKKG